MKSSELTRVFCALALMLPGGLTTGSATMTLAAETTVAQAALSEGEQAWLQQNPVLAEIAITAPDQLRDILDKLSAAIASPSSTRGGVPPLDEDAARLLEQNPALLQAWRSSPEASADLLQLIRVAAGGGKPRK